jgi:hypothetical protein
MATTPNSTAARSPHDELISRHNAAQERRTMRTAPETGQSAAEAAPHDYNDLLVEPPWTFAS